ncbi:ribosome silencing factor [bacterium]|nr:ribosome silencing factor [bacterium]
MIKEAIIKFVEKIDFIVDILREKKAEKINAIDLREIDGVITDGFVICSATSERQVDAIAEHLRISLKEKGEFVRNLEGTKLNQWVLVDACDIVIHIFLDRIRDFYRLDQLWAHAKQMPVPELTHPDTATG